MLEKGTCLGLSAFKAVVVNVFIEHNGTQRKGEHNIMASEESDSFQSVTIFPISIPNIPLMKSCSA
jgi:hypothetical protein